MSLTFKVAGDGKAVQEALAKISKKDFRKATRKAAKLVQAAAIVNAPVLSGTLRKAIKVRAAGRRRHGAKVTLQFKKGVTNSQFYGAFVEYGTAKQAAQNFMRRAAKSAGPGAIAQVRAEVLRLVNER